MQVAWGRIGDRVSNPDQCLSRAEHWAFIVWREAMDALCAEEPNSSRCEMRRRRVEYTKRVWWQCVQDLDDAR